MTNWTTPQARSELRLVCEHGVPTADHAREAILALLVQQATVSDDEVAR